MPLQRQRGKAQRCKSKAGSRTLESSTQDSRPSEGDCFIGVEHGESHIVGRASLRSRGKKTVPSTPASLKRRRISARTLGPQQFKPLVSQSYWLFWCHPRQAGDTADSVTNPRSVPAKRVLAHTPCGLRWLSQDWGSPSPTSKSDRSLSRQLSKAPPSPNPQTPRTMPKPSRATRGHAFHQGRAKMYPLEAPTAPS